ncbi:VanZ family protein [Adhaeribacter swui]|uniref:VanZ family protein n=1 Tax=Adhaeribacter swui TaxID=2086471 RepID=A0A7G7G3H6_9BACT|nr:VanZ family protein [Adhaeribacter swui]QNF31710.1 VanZ family protein [Adhaeribacter swui]
MNFKKQSAGLISPGTGTLALLLPYIPAVIWASIILVLTLLPPQALPKVPDWSLISINSLAHLFVFLIWSFLILFGYYRSKSNLVTRNINSIIITLLLAVSYGALIELLQGLMRLGRQPDIADIYFNTIGAVLGIIFFYLVKKYFKI